MSLDFSQKYDAPIVTTSLTPQDDGEVSLRPKLLADYTGQEKAKGNLAIYIEAAGGAMSRLTMSCSTARRVSARRRSQASSPTKWARASV